MYTNPQEDIELTLPPAVHTWLDSFDDEALAGLFTNEIMAWLATSPLSGCFMRDDVEVFLATFCAVNDSDFDIEFFTAFDACLRNPDHPQLARIEDNDTAFMQFFHHLILQKYAAAQAQKA